MTDLVTLEEYKTYASIRSEEQDERLTQLIETVSSLIKAYCGRTFIDFYDEADTMIFNGEYPQLFVREYPIRDVLSFEYSPDYGVTYTPLTEGTDFVIDYALDVVFVIIMPSVASVNGLKLQYRGGYETLPADLKLAVFDTIMYYAKSENNPKKVNGFVSIEYVLSADFPAHIKRVLDLYRTI